MKRRVGGILSDANRKKELQTQYREREVIGGVFAIRNKPENKLLLDITVNLQGSKNRFAFSQQTGSCTHMPLQKDWDRLGGEQFVFEVLEELKQGETQTQEEFKADLAVLKEIWLEKLSGDTFY